MGTSTSRHLPASAIMVRSNAAMTTVTPMGTFLSLMHLRLKPGDKLRGRGTAGKPTAQRAPQAPCSSCIPPTGAFNTFIYSHKARGGGAQWGAGSGQGVHPSAFMSLQGFLGLPDLIASSPYPVSQERWAPSTRTHSLSCPVPPAACKQLYLSCTLLTPGILTTF